jgi:hypothetical protein
MPDRLSCIGMVGVIHTRPRSLRASSQALSMLCDCFACSMILVAKCTIHVARREKIKVLYNLNRSLEDEDQYQCIHCSSPESVYKIHSITSYPSSALSRNIQNATPQPTTPSTRTTSSPIISHLSSGCVSNPGHAWLIRSSSTWLYG